MEPEQIVLLAAGCVVMAGAVVTVSNATLELMEGQLPVTIQRNLLAFIPAVTPVIVSVAVFAPVNTPAFTTLLYVDPPSVLICH